MPTVLIVAGTQPTTSDLHLLYHRAFAAVGWHAVFLSHDSSLPPGEKVLQQARLTSSPLHVLLFNRRLRRVARDTQPDLVFVSGSNWYIQPETLRWLQRRLGAKIVLNEQHLQIFRPHQVESLPVYDHVFTQDGGLISQLASNTSVRGVSLLGPACDPQEHRPIDLDTDETADLGADVCYLGYGYANRLRLMEGLTGFDLRLWGMGWDASPALRPFFRDEPVHGLKKTKIYNATRVTLNVQSTHYQLDGVTCRPFEVAASGGFCLCEPRRDLGRFFRPDEEVVTFADETDLKSKVAYFLAHPDERREIAQRARSRVLREHTYEHRVRQVLATLRLD